ncbi:MAG: 2-C-methyl-D-erythritol 4-phosphate cytidylyltransferase [Bacteroidales bacterium]|nr:2-C-methyl-D-erythritol 4-phosphate cytidylyltransferase [Bacteroidales bacterium]
MNNSFKLNAVIIVAGGSGKRMKSQIPKQFLLLRDLPVLMHTIKKFYDFDNETEIILVLPENQFEYWENLCLDFSFKITHKLVKGGSERFYSVRNGLNSIIRKNGIIAIHDGVRPLVDFETIKRGLESAFLNKAAIPVIPELSSIRIIENENSTHFDRNKIRIVQTPQIFDLQIIKSAYNVDFSSIFTDDASVAEAFGQKIHLFDGNIENIKITTKFDLDFANFLLSKRN